MKNKLLKVSVIALAIILLLQVAVFAAVEKLTFKTTTEKDFYSIGDKVTVTVDWTEGMQAAVYKVKYDAEKLTFGKASVAASYYNTETAGVISVQWASLEEQDLTKMTFEFTAKAAGKATFSVVDAKFMDGNLEAPSSYDVTTSGTKEITINKKVEPVTLSSIAITKEPTLYTYKEGGKFDKTGMEVTATYSDGTKKVITDYTYSPAEALKVSDTKVVISYTENGVTKTVEQKISVVPVIADKDTENKVENNTTNKNNTTANTTNKKDNTTASGKMPQTGAENVVFVIALVAVVGTIGFIKYRGLSDI